VVELSYSDFLFRIVKLYYSFQRGGEIVDSSDRVEGVLCYMCGKVKGIDWSLYFDKKYFCSKQCEGKWAKELIKQGATHRKPRKSKAKAQKPTSKAKSKKLWFW